MCIKQLCCLKWMILDLLLSCQANACNGRDAQPVVLVVGRRGMVVPVRLGAESSCICITVAYTDDSAAFLELESEFLGIRGLV
jgi:glycosylphosphatidylinositol transamidase (GPIT) subunit GPI8